MIYLFFNKNGKFSSSSFFSLKLLPLTKTYYYCLFEMRNKVYTSSCYFSLEEMYKDIKESDCQILQEHSYSVEIPE